MPYVDTFQRAFADYARYVGAELTEPSWPSYLYALLLVSLVVYAAELVRPWRPAQPKLRRDFFLDGFYMFWNFFLFSLLGYHAVASVVAQMVADLGATLGLTRPPIDVASWPVWTQLLVMFVLRDFVHYWVHRLLHRVPALWELHKVHHSVTEMGFAAHLRYHFMETVVYRTLEFLPLALIGFGVREFFAVHLIALTIGHLNHANFHIPMGPLRYVFNSAEMHIWHHAKDMPRRYGANYAISLSVWDWLFGTVHWPHEGRDITLGFDDVERYPTGFFAQLTAPLRDAVRVVTRRAS